jgi:hypothetical protein
MPLNVPILASLGLLLLAVYRFILYPTLLSPLSKIPNAHWSAPISVFWILWTRFQNHENTSVHAAHLKHGPVVRLAPNEISVNDIDGLRTVYAGGFVKGEWYAIFDNYGYVLYKVLLLTYILTKLEFHACFPLSLLIPIQQGNA